MYLIYLCFFDLPAFSTFLFLSLIWEKRVWCQQLNNMNVANTNKPLADETKIFTKKWRHDNSFLIGFGTCITIGVAVFTAIVLSLLLLNLYHVTVVLTWKRTDCTVTSQLSTEVNCGFRPKAKCSQPSLNETSSDNSTTIPDFEFDNSTLLENSTVVDNSTTANITTNCIDTNSTERIFCKNDYVVVDYEVNGASYKGNVSRYCYMDVGCELSFFSAYSIDSLHSCFYNPTEPNAFLLENDLKKNELITLCVFGGILCIFLILAAMLVLFIAIYCPIQHLRFVREKLCCCLICCYNSTEKKKYKVTRAAKR